MINKVALTENGNQYKKTNIGKAVGNIPSAALLTASGVATARHLIKGTFSKVDKGDLGTGLIGIAALSVIGTTIGAIIDRCINKDRRIQADGEAAKLNKQA